MRKTATWAAVRGCGRARPGRLRELGRRLRERLVSSSSADGSSASDAVLTTADSDLGTIVVDADGRTVYVFDKDTAGSGDERLQRGLPGEVAGRHGRLRRARGRRRER